MGDSGKPTEELGLTRGRERRARKENTGRAAAFERLRNLKEKGAKNKYEIAEMQNVYDVVDEGEYSKIVSSRAKEDWIVDDGSGYCEDGREVFDEDMAEAETAVRKKRKPKLSKTEKEEAKAEKEAHKSGINNLRDMFSNMSGKRKREPQPASSVEKDELLKDLMAELHNEKSGPSSSEKIMQKIAMPGVQPLSVTRPQFMKPELKKLKKWNCVASSAGIMNKSDYSQSSFGYKSGSKNEKNGKGEENSKDYASASSPAHYDDFDDPFDDNVDFSDPIDDAPVEVKIVVNKTVEPPPKSKPSSNGATGHRIEVSTVKSSTSLKQPSEATAVPPVSVKVEPGTNNLDMIDDISQYLNDADAADSFGDEMDTCNFDSAPSMVNVEQSGGKMLNFYWLDMFEEPKTPGFLFLFGKVKSPPPAQGYSSCCVVVKNLTRRVFLLPRVEREDKSPITCEDVCAEWSDVISPKFKIVSFRTKKVQKKYCFDLKDVPPTSDYLEIRYSGTLPPLPNDLKGETFSCAFGTNNPLMETFLMEKKLKGPGWLQISNCEEVLAGKQQSWSKFEFSCDVGSVRIHPQGQTLQPPTLVLVSLNIQSVSDATSKKDSIIFAGVAVNKNFLLQSPLPPNQMYHDFFGLINKPPGEIWPFDVERIVNKRTSKMDSERSMLGCLLARLHQLDPDVYVGHDLNFELLMLQLLHFKVPHWSRIGRLKRSTPVTKNNKMLDWKAALAGRLVCDVKTSAMELIRARSYDLPTLGAQVLGMKEDQIGTLTGPEMKQLYNSSEGLRSFVRWGMQHCVLNIRLINELQVMPLAVQITTIAGNTLSRTLLGGRAERNEYLLLHAFNAKDYIVPDKFKPFTKFVKKEKGTHEDTQNRDGGADGPAEGNTTGKDGGGKSSGPSYSGGLVLAPKKGFYDDYIVLMDFNSLYPSIIQEFNVCFTTNVVNEDCETEDESKRGVLPEEIRKLVESRKQVKGLMKGPNVSQDLMRQYDIRQKALKLTANSMYGCLGFRMSRFYAQELAAYITGKGRDILLKTKDSVEKMGFEVIYGDTDSLMINSHTQDIAKVFQIGNKIKFEINRTYKLLELEIDGIFRFLLLLKKKKYAALVCNPKPNGEHEYVMELKGLDIVRRDWAPVGATTAKLCLNEIMSEQPLDDKIYKVCKILGEISTKLREGQVDLKDLLITKQLAKNPEEYKAAQGLYHVQVALRMNESGKLPKKFRNGDTVSYLFCTDGQPHHLMELSQPIQVKKEEVDEQGVIKEVIEEKMLKADPEYYLAHQVHPVVSRICDPIPGLDPARIAESLGLDSTSYKRKRVIEENEDKYLGHQTEAEKYLPCEKFTINCVHCNTAISFQSALYRVDGNGPLEFSLFKCPNSECRKVPWSSMVKLKNKLTLLMRKYINKYYKNLFVCEDPSCTNSSNAIPLYLERGYPICACKQAVMYKDYPDSQLYTQLNYFQFIFDLHKGIEELKKDEKDEIKRRLYEQEKKKNGVVVEKGEIESAYAELLHFVKQTLNSSAYSDINLKQLFSIVPHTQRKIVNTSG